MSHRYQISEALFASAKEILPGGVNSPVRAFRGVGGTPPFICQGEGAYVVDEDGNRYLDFVSSWGPLIAGHAHPSVREAVHRAVDNGFSFGAPTKGEIELATEMRERVPGLEMVRLVTSGTEATMSAVRVARGVTGRDKVIKFDGCYHGHSDCFLIAAGSGMLDIGTPDSPGVPRSVASDTLVAQYNDANSARALFEAYPNDVAAIIVEPVGGNAGCIPPADQFLEELRRLCDRYGAVLIFDEVMTGFRVGRGGAAQLFGITPDLYTFGKIIGGGFPIGAYGGRKDLMKEVAPSGGIYQAGTLSGNPVAVAAGLATLKLLDEEAYVYLERLGSMIESAFVDKIERHEWPIVLQRVGSMYSVFFSERPVTCVQDTVGADVERFSTFFHGLLADGYYVAPSAFECSFLSLAHTENEIEAYLKAAFDRLEQVFDLQPESVFS